MRISLIRNHHRWLGMYILVLLCMSSMNEQASAQHNYVLRDGRMVPMIKSDNEWGITLRESQNVQDAGIRISAQRLGEVSDFNDNPNSRYKIIKTQSTVLTRQDLLEIDPDIIEVFPVFRFQGRDNPIISTGTVLVKVLRGITDVKRAKLWADYDYVEIHAVQGQPRVYKIKPINPNADEVVDAQEIARDPRTHWAQPNLRRPIDRLQITPSDPLFSFQWQSQNIKAPEAWLIADGQDVLIGMFDDACDVDHKDLFDGYIDIGHDPSLPSTDNGFEDPRPKQIFDNHGTRVMGLAVARGNNLGVRGVAFQARFTASRGLNSAITEEDIASTYTFARQQEVDVHINSWGFIGGIPNPAVVEDAIELAFREGRNKGDLDDDDEDDPLGMVIVFATGNGGVDGQGDQNFKGFELSTMPQVIGAGANDPNDAITGFSNFGEHQNVLAPGVNTATTDNEDRDDAIDFGANIGGINIGGFLDIESSGSYTGFFSGTSASCPIVAGVAALILSQNPLLTASDVRLIINHSAQQVQPFEAQYHGITSHSLRYGYGRVDAEQAALQAKKSLEIGNRTWPDSPANIRVSAFQLQWIQNIGTDEFLVVESTIPFTFIPQDGKCYDRDQLFCSTAPIETLPNGVSIAAVGCKLSCDSGGEAKCETGADQCIGFAASGKRFLAIYSVSATGRYSFGVAVDTDGNVAGEGDIIAPGIDVGDGIFLPPVDGETPPEAKPSVTIQATPLEGFSPLTVHFRGNAVSEVLINGDETFWDFDLSSDSDDDGDAANDKDATSRTVDHTYDVPDGESRLFLARLTMVDDNGVTGSEEVSIRVDGKEVDNGIDSEGSDFRVIVGTPTNPNADLSIGASPFQVMLNLDTNTIEGVLESVVWDLGDGNTANTLSVPHTYINITAFDLRLPITVTITTRTSANSTTSAVTTKIITVQPGDADVEIGRPRLPGTGAQGVGGVATPCGAVGLIPMLGMMFSLMLMRRRWA